MLLMKMVQLQVLDRKWLVLDFFLYILVLNFKHLYVELTHYVILLSLSRFWWWLSLVYHFSVYYFHRSFFLPDLTMKFVLGVDHKIYSFLTHSFSYSCVLLLVPWVVSWFYAELPLEPSLAKTLMEANNYGCLYEALTVAAMLSAETTLLPGQRWTSLNSEVYIDR